MGFRRGARPRARESGNPTGRRSGAYDGRPGVRGLGLAACYRAGPGAMGKHMNPRGERVVSAAAADRGVGDRMRPGMSRLSQITARRGGCRPALESWSRTVAVPESGPRARSTGHERNAIRDAAAKIARQWLRWWARRPPVARRGVRLRQDQVGGGSGWRCRPRPRRLAPARATLYLHAPHERGRGGSGPETARRGVAGLGGARRVEGGESHHREGPGGGG